MIEALSLFSQGSIAAVTHELGLGFHGTSETMISAVLRRRRSLSS
jgi:hypothetical protein